MSKKSFAPVGETPAEEAANVDTSVLDAVDGDGGGADLPMIPQNTVFGAVTGDVKAYEVKPARLKIACGVGFGAEKGFTPGDFVLDESHLIGTIKGTPLVVILLSANKYYKEYTEYGTGEIPRTWPTEEAAKADGMITAWGPSGSGIKPTVAGAMTIRMIIQKPADLVCGLFGVDIGGQQWAPVIWDADKTAYKHASSPIYQAASVALRERGLYSGKWSLSAKMEKNKKGNVYPVPVLAQNQGYVSDEFIAELKQKLGVK